MQGFADCHYPRGARSTGRRSTDVTYCSQFQCAGASARDHEGRSSVEWPGERRSHCRYPIRLDLEFTLIHNDRATLTGRGRIINLSTSGVLFESDSDLPSGMRIELSIDWPVMLNGEVRLRLHVKGKIVRAMSNRIAVTVQHYDFRTTSRERFGDR
jgi:PilZ domain